MSQSQVDRDAWEAQHYAQMRRDNPDFDKPKADPRAKLRKELRENDPTLPAVVGNNNLSAGRFSSLAEDHGNGGR